MRNQQELGFKFFDLNLLEHADEAGFIQFKLEVVLGELHVWGWSHWLGQFVGGRGSRPLWTSILFAVVWLGVVLFMVHFWANLAWCLLASCIWLLLWWSIFFVVWTMHSPILFSFAFDVIQKKGFEFVKSNVPFLLLFLFFPSEFGSDFNLIRNFTSPAIWSMQISVAQIEGNSFFFNLVVERVDHMGDGLLLLNDFQMLFNLLEKSCSFFFLSPFLVDLDLIVNNSAFLILLS